MLQRRRLAKAGAASPPHPRRDEFARGGRFPSAVLTIQRFNESRGDSPIDRFITEHGKALTRIWSEWVSRV
jgi:hypothetical protein